MCSCNLIWMRAWLQEAGVVGPRCSDGTLLRELRLSRQECMYEQRTANPVAPGCEAELLSVPPYSTSQVFSQWMDLKEKEPPTAATKPLTVNMAPSPEESEYFYDEYIDYPYNDTFSNHSLTHKSNSKSEFTTPSTPNKMSSHYIPGDTPVLYAAVNKNKTKTTEEPNTGSSTSPSSSGFTFFGVPLPALNNLWPGGGRSSDRKADQTKNRVSSGRGGNLFPPTEPEIQKGGFVPILPGTSGGFRPIPNPMTQNYSYHVERIHMNISTTRKPNATTIVPSSLLVDVTEDFLSKRGPVVNVGHPIPAPTSMTTSTISSFKPMPHFTISMGQNNEEKDSDKSETQSTKSTMELTTFTTVDQEETTAFEKKTTAIDLITPPSVFDKQTTSLLTTTVEIETASQSESFEDLFQDVIENVPIPVATTMIPITLSTMRIERPEVESTSFKPEVEVSKPTGNNTPSTLSTFLIPGGQQPPFRPMIGRSTITKVVSPHVSSTASLQAVPEPKEEALSTTLNNNHNHKPKTSLHGDHSSTSQIPPHDSSMSWYFMNYNKTNLQPYIDPAYSKISRSNQFELSASVTSLVITLTVTCLHYVY